jgi:hypothetical protein
MREAETSEAEAIERRARDLLPGLKADAAILTAAPWPTKPGSLPTCGHYWVDEQTDFLGPLMLSLGPWIWKAGAGIRFDIDTVNIKVEFHPDQVSPASFITDFGSPGSVKHVLERYLLLEPNWYLAWYSVVDLPV